MNFNIIEITPQMARKWLDETNTSNRLQRKGHIKNLAKAMTSGVWRTTAQGIVFDTNGKLQDGQHRLEAIVLSGKTVKMVVTTGSDPQNYDAIDIGAKRDVSDIYNISKPVGSCIYLTAWLCSVDKVSMNNIKPYVDKYNGIYQELVDYCGTSIKLFSSTPVKVAAVYNVILNKQNKEYIFDLYRNIVLQNVTQLPPVALTLVSQVAKGLVRSAGGDAQLDILAKCVSVFDKDKQFNERITIKNRSIVLDKVRKVFVIK